MSTITQNQINKLEITGDAEYIITQEDGKVIKRRRLLAFFTLTLQDQQLIKHLKPASIFLFGLEIDTLTLTYKYKQ